MKSWFLFYSMYDFEQEVAKKKKKRSMEVFCITFFFCLFLTIASDCNNNTECSTESEGKFILHYKIL